MAKEIFGANLKMNPVCNVGGNSLFDISKLFREYENYGIKSGGDKEVIAFVPLIFVHGLRTLESANVNHFAGIKLGAQDVSEHLSGAHTGETSPFWLREYGIDDVLIGHSEVRDWYEKLIISANGNIIGTIDDMFNRKIINALKHGLRVTYCVGETAEEKESGLTFDVLKRQIEKGLKDTQSLDGKIIIAYEPRWSIGGNKPTPTPKEIQEVHEYIRETILKLIMPHSYRSNYYCEPVIYGGSMKPENAAQIMGTKGVNGGLMGSASLDAEKFAKIVNYDR